MKNNDNSTLKLLHDIANLKHTTFLELENEYGFNRAQIKYRIARINDYLKYCGLEQLEIDGENISSPFDWQYINESFVNTNNREFIIDSLNTEIRRAAETIYIFISTCEVSLNHIQTYFKISKNTVISDIKQIREWANHHNVKLSYTRELGYYYEGTYNNIYNFIMREIDYMGSSDFFVSFIYTVLKSEFPILPQQIAKEIKRVLNENNIEYKNEFLNRSSCLLVLLLLSKEKHDYNHSINNQRDTNNKLYEICSQINESLKNNFDCYLDKNDFDYLYILLIFITKKVDALTANKDEAYLYKHYSSEIISQLIFLTNNSDEYSKEIENKLSIELQFLHFCKVYDFPVVYPKLIVKKREYSDLYSVVGMILHSLNMNELINIGSDEIAFIADVLSESYKCNDVNIVFDEKEENTKIYEENKIIESLKQFCDITDEIGLRNLLRIINPNQRKVICESLCVPSLYEVLEDNIMVIDNCDGAEKAIEIASQPLLQSGSIEKEYINELIDSFKKRNNHFCLFPMIMMPHGKSEKVIKMGMSLLKINKPIVFEDKQISIVIVLASVDNKMHSKALAELADILQDENNRDELISSNSVEDILHMITKEGR